MAIIIRDVRNPQVSIYNPEGAFVCETDNNLVFNDIRIQIKDQQLSGYSIEFRGKKYTINKHGELDTWPEGLFEIATTQLNYLLDI